MTAAATAGQVTTVVLILLGAAWMIRNWWRSHRG
jgi:hypothetical protein